jgi:hypothetical protein
MVFRSSMSTRTGLSSAWDSWCVCLNMWSIVIQLTCAN